MVGWKEGLNTVKEGVEEGRIVKAQDSNPNTRTLLLDNSTKPWIKFNDDIFKASYNICACQHVG